MKTRIYSFIEHCQQQGKQYWTTRIVQQPQVQQAWQWYANKSARDQKILQAITATIFLFLIWSVVYAPLLASRQIAQESLNKHLATYHLIASNAGQFGSVSAASDGAQTSVLAAVTQSARNQSINLSRYEQDGVNLRIWLEKVAFDDAIGWLENLQSKHAIVVSQISVDKSISVGRVDIRATLGH